MPHQATTVPDRLPLRALVVTGTDTGVGKTHVAASVVSQLRQDGFRVGAYKPVCSGASRRPDGSLSWDDIDRLVAELDPTVRPALAPLDEAVCPQRFSAALAPPLAARVERRTVDADALAAGLELWRGQVEAVVIEGVGGWLCPLTETALFADLALQWRLPVVIVARRRLGTINHTLLTIESVRSRSVPLVGIVLNEAEPAGDDCSVNENAAEIERRSGVPVLGELLHGDCGQLRRAGHPVRIRWWDLMADL